MPTESMVTAKKFFICRFLSFSTAGIFSGTFDAAVPASVVVGAITVVLVVCFVVLGIVRHEVVKRESVMTRHKVNTLLRLPFLMTVNCRATNQTVGKTVSSILLRHEKKLRTSSRKRPFHSFHYLR